MLRAVIVIAFLVVAAAVAIFPARSTQARLDKDCVLTMAELQRLESVVQRHAELHEKEVDLRRALAGRGVSPTLASPQAPLAGVHLGNPPTPPERNPFMLSQAIEDRRNWLDRANREIMHRLNLEKALPAREREIAALEARVAELDAGATASQGQGTR